MRERLKRFQPDLIILAILLIAPLLFFFPQTLGNKTLLPADNLYEWEPYRAMREEVDVGEPDNLLLSDLVLENLVWKQFARRQIGLRQIPLWQPNILAGSPFLAAGQSSVLYPFSLIYFFVPIEKAYGWFTVLQLWLAGTWMYVLMRVLGVRRTSGLISGLAYQLSAYFVISAVFPMIIGTAAWLPLELAMIELVIRRKEVNGRASTLPWVAIGGIGLGMASLAGHVEALLFTLMVMGFFAIWRLIAEGIARRKDKDVLRWLAGRGLWLAGMVALGLALGAVQVIPSYQLATRSFRTGGAAATFYDVLAQGYPARRILAFVMPDFFGNPSHHAYFDLFSWRMVPVEETYWGIKNYVEGAVYMGLLPMALAGLAALHWIVKRIITRADWSLGAETPARPYRLIFGTLGVFSVLFAFGRPVYALLYYGLPFFSQSRAPFRWMWPLTLCVAALAGFGADLLTLGDKSEKQPPGSPVPGRLIDIAGWGLIGGSGLLALGVILSRVFYGAVGGWVESAYYNLAKASDALPSPLAFYSYEMRNVLLFAAMLLLTGIVIRVSRCPIFLPERFGRRPIWEPLAALVVIVDLGVWSYGFNPAANPDWLSAVPDSIQWMREQKFADPLDPWRFGVYEEPGADTMNDNIGWLHDLESIGGYDSLIPGQYAAYMHIIMPQTDLLYNRIAPLYDFNPDALDSPLLDLLGTRYIVSEVEIDNPRYDLAYQDDALLIYQNNEALPRAFTLPVSSLHLYDWDESAGLPTFEQLALETDVRQHVLVPVDQVPGALEDRAGEVTGEPADYTPATITVYNAQEVWVDLDLDEESFLIVSNSYFPGWRAWQRELGAPDSSEEEVEVTLVNGNFMGVYLPPGQWTVRFKYSPDSFRFGAFTSFLTFMGLIFASGVWAWRLIYRGREVEEGSDVQRVAKNTVTPIVLNLFNKGIQFVLTFAMLRVLGPAGAGDYRYAFTIYGWFEILANFGLNTFLTREVARHKDSANRYLMNTSILRMLLVLIGIPALIGFLLIRQAIVSPPLNPSTLWTIGLLYFGLFFSTISTGLTALFYAFEKAEHPAAIQTVAAFLTTSLGIGSLLLGWGIVGLAAVSVAVNFIVLVSLGFVAIRLFFKPRLVYDWKLQRSALGESFPLMLNHLLATLFFRIEIVLLEAMQGSTVVGWYGVVYTWVDAIMVIPSFFTMSLFPIMSRQAVEDRPALKRAYILAIKLMSLITVPTAIMTTLLAPVLVRVLGGSQYLPHGAIALRIFIWSILFGWINSVTQYVIIALNRQRTLTIAFAIVSVFVIGTNLYYIPRYSYPAAAVIAILAEMVLLGMFYVVILSELGRIPWFKMLWRIAAAGLACGAVTVLLDGVNMWLAFLGGTGVYVAGVIVLRVFAHGEMKQLAGVLPGPVQRLLMPNVEIEQG